jgi:histidine triad (HIT) family protein/ATP adenylyltransferase
MYLASLGSPERNPHLHLHICPCPEGTPFDQQQFAAMQFADGRYLSLADERLDELAARISVAITHPS